MKKIVLTLFLFALVGSAAVAQKKLSKDELARFTPEQRIIYERSLKKKVNKKSNESVKKKAKRANKLDRKSRRIKQPKPPALKKR